MIVVEIDDVLLRLAHLFEPADRHRPAGRRSDQSPAVASLDLLREEPLAGAVLIGLVQYHALGEQAGERLVEVEIAALASSRG